MTYTVKLLGKEKVTHDVIGLTLERPQGYRFTPGQCAELTLERPGGLSEKDFFSFTGLNSEPGLKLILKTSPVNPDINAHLRRVEVGDVLRIGEPRDEVVYRGPGVFIAGGTGIAPFMAIFRQLHVDGTLDGNILLYANKRGEDICFEGELRTMLGDAFISILALEDKPRNAVGEIDAGFIHRHVQQLDRPFYVCGPEPFVNSVDDALQELGVKEGMVALHSKASLPERSEA